MTRTWKRPTGRGAAMALAVGTALALGACGFNTTEFGNTITDCPAGTSCSCGTGNCVMGCSGGGCNLTCTGYSNCDFDCAGGGCNVDCANTGNCFVDCAGGYCDLTCRGTGNCGVTSCSTGCTTQCLGTGNCL